MNKKEEFHIEILGAYYALGSNSLLPDAVSVEITLQGELCVTFDCETAKVRDSLTHLNGSLFLEKQTLRQIERAIYAEIRAMAGHARGLKSPEFFTGVFFPEGGLYTLETGRSIYIIGNTICGVAPAHYLISNDTACFCINQGECVNLKELFDSFLNVNKMVYFSFCYVLLSLLRDECPYDFQGVLYLHGGQNLGKTTLIRQLLNWVLHAESGRPALCLSSASSTAALNYLLYNTTNFPILVDDFCKSASSKSQRDRKDKGGELLRSATSKLDVVKYNTKDEIIRYNCSTNLIFTAEIQFENESDVTRCLFAPIHEPVEYTAGFTSQAIGRAVIEFLRWYAEDLEFHRTITARGIEKIPEHLGRRVENNLKAMAWIDTLFKAFARDMTEMPWKFPMKKAIKASADIQEELLAQIRQKQPVGNLAFILYHGHKAQAFRLAKKGRI